MNHFWHIVAGAGPFVLVGGYLLREYLKRQRSRPGGVGRGR
ncbi:hypothetical protein [Nakamurella alba]|nr:hypothetical protein [Nakamurella alba]